MKLWLAKDGDGSINLFPFRPRKVKMFLFKERYEGGAFPPVWSNVPWNLLEELEICEKDLDESPLEVEISIKKL